MEGPTRAALEEILADLLQLPDDDPDKAAAVAKVRRQLASLGVDSEFTEPASSAMLPPSELE
jgi:hypothetical protein